MKKKTNQPPEIKGDLHYEKFKNLTNNLFIQKLNYSITSI
jgi:hypothetical protein